MERAPEQARTEEHHAEPMPRDPDLPSISDTSVIFFAAGALIVTLVALWALL